MYPIIKHIVMEQNMFTDLLHYTDLDLRPYQNENKAQIYKLWSENRAVMLQMPTGTGKTRLFVSILKDLHKCAVDRKKQIRVLILVHRVELIDQISDELGVRYGLAHGFIHSKDRERRKFPFQIASVQTLNRRLDNWKDYDFDFIIVDEAHHVLAESYRKIISTFPNAKILGVTATPYRLSGVGFRPEFDKLIVSDSIQEFINKGYLCNYEYYSISPFSYVQNEINNIQGTDASGDFANTEMQKVCDQDKIRAQIVETYLSHAKGKKGIVYTINKTHNKHLCEAFCEKGLKAVAIDSDTDIEERERMIEDFKQNKIDIICNVDIFSEGFDCPDIEFVQLARPTKSLSLYLQQVGRGLRISANKEKTIFLDNVGLYNRFGVPAANRYWEDYFEGIEGASESKGSSKEDKSEKESIRRERDLSEGNEKVHLIHDTLDDDYAYERAKIVNACDFGFYLINWCIIDFLRNRYLHEYVDKMNYKYAELSVRRIEDVSQVRFPQIALLDEYVEEDILQSAKEDISKLYKCTFDSHYELEVAINESSFEECLKNKGVTMTKEECIETIKWHYDNFLLGKIDKKIIKTYKDYIRQLRKQRIGREERMILRYQYKFVLKYMKKDQSKIKELFNLKRYMDEMEHMGNTDNIDQIKLDRFNELIKEGEQKKK